MISSLQVLARGLARANPGLQPSELFVWIDSEWEGWYADLVCGVNLGLLLKHDIFSHILLSSP
jgi:hypothetical protein